MGAKLLPPHQLRHGGTSPNSLLICNSQRRMCKSTDAYSLLLQHVQWHSWSPCKTVQPCILGCRACCTQSCPPQGKVRLRYNTITNGTAYLTPVCASVSTLLSQLCCLSFNAGLVATSLAIVPPDFGPDTLWSCACQARRTPIINLMKT